MRGVTRSSALLLLSLALGWWPISAMPQQPADCRLVAAYGTVYDELGNEIPADAGSRDELLAEVLACAERHLSPAEAMRYQASVPPIISGLPDSGTRAERLLLQTELAAAISSNPTVRQQDEVARRLLNRIGDQGVTALARNRGLLETLTDNGWRGFDRSSVPPDRASDYVDQCRAAGVPVPPPIEPPTAQGWKPGPALAWSRKDWLLSSPSLAVWNYSDADGFCVALRRGQGEDAAIGTICSNHAQTQACFFDSLTYRDGQVVALPESAALTADYATLVHPQDIKNRCDGCHVGANPFIVNPRAPLGRSVQSLYTQKPSRFAFVGATLSGWHNPPPSALDPKTPEGACVSCHQLPGADTGSYCTNVLQRAGGLFMPPAWHDDAGWREIDLWPDSTGCPPQPKSIPEPLLDFVQSVHALKRLCRPNLTVPDCPSLN